MCPICFVSLGWRLRTCCICCCVAGRRLWSLKVDWLRTWSSVLLSLSWRLRAWYLLLPLPSRARGSEGSCSAAVLSWILNGCWSAIVSPLQAGDSEQDLLVSLPFRDSDSEQCPLTSFPLQNGGVSVSVSLDVPETQNKGRYLYLFPMRRRLQSGASPFPGCNWLFPSEWGGMVWPTLLSFWRTYLHCPNTHLEKCHKNLTSAFFTYQTTARLHLTMLRTH